jgi:heme/copper-type cytochrome/quinol oxidase subunit 2
MFIFFVFPVFILALLGAYYYDYRQNKVNYKSNGQGNLYMLVMAVIIIIILIVVYYVSAFLLS